MCYFCFYLRFEIFFCLRTLTLFIIYDANYLNSSASSSSSPYIAHTLHFFGPTKRRRMAIITPGSCPGLAVKQTTHFCKVPGLILARVKLFLL